MFIAMPNCSWKCCTESGLPTETCQNSPLANQKNIEVDQTELIENYMKNPITKSVVFGGLEPLDSFEEVQEFIHYLRFIYICNDDVIIYTGYYKEEIQEYINKLIRFNNIILKCGRYVPNKPSKYDENLGVKLASDNQYTIVLRW
jgi:hypothetical protein